MLTLHSAEVAAFPRVWGQEPKERPIMLKILQPVQCASGPPQVSHILLTAHCLHYTVESLKLFQVLQQQQSFRLLYPFCAQELGQPSPWDIHKGTPLVSRPTQKQAVCFQPMSNSQEAVVLIFCNNPTSNQSQSFPKLIFPQLLPFICLLPQTKRSQAPSCYSRHP